jgi:hypothetical protein
VSSSWPKFKGNCKSRLSALARGLFLGRNHWFEKYQEATELFDASREEIATLLARCGRLEEEAVKTRERISELERQTVQAKPVEWPIGQVPPGQQFGAGIIALCVNLAREIGLRPVERVLKIFSEWMNVKVRIPTYQAIRGWMQRIGLDRMKNAKKTSGGIWVADHTNQIGKEKVLVVLRVRESQMPPQGVPLRHRDVEVLALVPGTEWKREDVAEVYRATEDRFGVPRAVESDGAVELREPVENLGKSRTKPIVIRDPKHFLANRLEALLNKDPEYQKFVQKLGWARSALQQTELAHFIPPGIKAKSRFMNLAPTLNWAMTMLWHLEHPESQSREGITESRMEEKMGWLRGFAGSVRQWQECQQVISIALTFINEQGIFRGATQQFQTLVADIPHYRMSRKLLSDVVEFFREHEKKLRSDERLPMSTEIIESSFSRYKQFEKQHSKNGFSSLLLTFPTLLRKTTPKEVKASFARVRIADVKAWVKTYMPSTLASKRQLIYRESKKNIKTKIEKRATPISAAA